MNLFRRSKAERERSKALRQRIDKMIAVATLNHDEEWFTAKQLSEDEAECIDKSILNCLKGEDNHA